MAQDINSPPETATAPAATSSMAIAYCPPDTKFWFIWSGRSIRVQYGQDRPAVVELPAPVPVPRRPPFTPGGAAFADACDAWLKDDVAVVDAVLKALQGQPDPQTVAMLRAFAEGHMAG